MSCHEVLVLEFSLAIFGASSSCARHTQSRLARHTRSYVAVEGSACAQPAMAAEDVEMGKVEELGEDAGREVLETLAPSFVCNEVAWTHTVWEHKVEGTRSALAGFPATGGKKFAFSPITALDTQALELLHRHNEDGRLTPFVLVGETEGHLVEWLTARHVAPLRSTWKVSFIPVFGTLSMTRRRNDMKLHTVRATEAKWAGVEWKGVWVVSARLLLCLAFSN